MMVRTSQKSLHLHVIMMVLLDWQIIAVWLWQLDQPQILAAMLEVNYTILKPTNGVMHLIIPLLRELFLFNKHVLYVTVFRIICPISNVRSISLLNIFSQIAFYSVASTDEASFVIGGCDGTSCSSPSDVIAQFKNNVWSLYAKLKNRRGLHGSVTYRGQTMVIGGFSLDNQ